MVNLKKPKQGGGPPSWDDIRVFLSVVRYGSTYRAAQMIGIDHTTVGRRLQSLEDRLRLLLFERRGGRLQLTADGQLILGHAKRMEAAAHELVAQSAQTSSLRGQVSINISEGLANFWLIPALRPFLLEHPEISVRWRTMDREFLVPGEQADLAIWWWTPQETHLIRRKLGTVGYSMFMTRECAATTGIPRSLEELEGHKLLHFDSYEINPAFANWNALVRRIGPSVLLGNTALTLNVMKGTHLLALLPDYSPLIEPDMLVRIPVDMGIALEGWLVYHRDQRSVPRVRAVADEIARLAKLAVGTWFS